MNNATHEYPPAYPPGKHWSIDAAWEILDTLKPGLIPQDARCFLAGQIAGRLAQERQKLMAVLEASVQFQSHYAQLLNMYDGGERMAFASAEDWLARLDALEK